MKTRLLTLPMSMLMISFGLSAASMESDTIDDGTKESRKVELINLRRDSVLSEIIKKDMSVGPREVPTPHFAIRTKNNKFILTIGGYINPIIGVDLGNDLYKVDGAGIGFVTSQIPAPAREGKKSDFYINPFQGMVSLQIIGLGGTENQVSAYFQIGAEAMNPSLNLSRAYLTYRRFTAGLKLTLMQDVYACQPPTIDPQGPSGCVSTAAYEVSYKSKSYNGFMFAVGLDYPTFNPWSGKYLGNDYPEIDNSQITTTDIDQMVPDIPMWVEYQKSPTMRVRLSGLLRSFRYKDILADKMRCTFGWGVMLSGNVQPVKPLTLYLQAVYGQGIGNYIQDIAGIPISYIPDDAVPGKMSATPMMGLNLGASVQINKRWQWNIMASEARVWNVKNYCLADPDNDYKYGFYFATNVFYHITDYLQWGMEYLYGKHGTWSGVNGHDNRIQTQLMFTF